MNVLTDGEDFEYYAAVELRPEVSLSSVDGLKVEVERAVPEVMLAFNNAERVKKVKVLGEEWLPDSDLLTPTSKLKRRGVNERFSVEIEAFYSAPR